MSASGRLTVDRSLFGLGRIGNDRHYIGDGSRHGKKNRRIKRCTSDDNDVSGKCFGVGDAFLLLSDTAEPSQFETLENALRWRIDTTSHRISAWRIFTPVMPAFCPCS